MANVQNIERKAEQVSMVAEKVKKAQSVVVFDYRGISVAEDTELRAEMRKANVEYVVIKNHIMKRACENSGIDAKVADLLKGPSAFAFGYEELAAPARILKAFVKKAKKCEMKGGIVEGSVMDAAQINAIADLPSREVLIARMLGSMMAPISQLAIVLDQIAKKQGEPEAQAE
ncbi:MAG TPA: 50S ribosomal protein L10 [Eubacteriales bacterium]|nr:50S ribosomal protein L10 [Eubacteriales bacterium]